LDIQKDIDFTKNFSGRSGKQQILDNKRKISVSRKTSLRYDKKLVARQKEKIMTKYHTTDTVMWIDNFNKFYKLTRPLYVVFI